jgi:elongation factor G
LIKKEIIGTHPDTEEEVKRKPDVKKPFTALAFKIATDPFVGRLCILPCLFRKIRCRFLCIKYKFSGNKNVFLVFSKCMQISKIPLTIFEAGDIGAAVGFKDIKTGDTLCDEKHPIVLEAMNFPEPVIGISH